MPQPRRKTPGAITKTQSSKKTRLQSKTASLATLTEVFLLPGDTLNVPGVAKPGGFPTLVRDPLGGSPVTTLTICHHSHLPASVHVLTDCVGEGRTRRPTSSPEPCRCSGLSMWGEGASGLPASCLARHLDFPNQSCCHLPNHFQDYQTPWRSLYLSGLSFFFCKMGLIKIHTSCRLVVRTQ